MPSDQTQQYRDHPAWLQLQQIDATLKSLSPEETTDNSLILLTIVDAGVRRRSSPAALSLYQDILDSINQVCLNYFQEATVRSGGSYPYISQLQTLVRQLPQMPNRELSEVYRQVVEEASEAARARFAQLDSDLSVSEDAFQAAHSSFVGKLKALETEIDNNRQSADQILTRVQHDVADGQAKILEVTSTAAASIKSDWTDELQKWRASAASDRQQHDTKFQEELALLVAAAQISQRLVEHAASNLTALDWTRRATRERRTGNLMRLLAILSLVAAVVFGTWMVAQALRDALTVGEGILRVAVVAAIAGLGGYLGTESRRHLHEADSAEEVSTVIQQMEPFLAGSDDRDAVRREVSDTVFVRNVLSRFTKRDAHGRQISEQNIPEVLTALTEAVKTLASTQRPGSGA